MEIEPKILTLEELQEAWHYSDKVDFNNVDEETQTEYHFSIINKDTLLISFQKSRQKLDWLHNFCFWKKPYKNMEETFFVHWGFLKKYKAIQAHIHRAIGEFAPKKILLRGYSQGGALSILCHEDIGWNYPCIDVQTIVFGSPRVFSIFNHRILKERLKNVIRVTYWGDLVTFVPPIIFGYRHYGGAIKIGKKCFFPRPSKHKKYDEVF